MSIQPASVVPTPTTLPPGVKCKECGWGRVYNGRREALVAAGLVTDDLFPGDAGMPRTSRWFDYGGRRINVLRTSSRRFDVRWPYTQDERAAIERHHAREQAFEAVRTHVAALPASASDYRAETLIRLRCLAEETAIDLCRRRGGYRFDDAARRAIGQAFGQLACAVASAAVTFDPAARDREVAGIYDRHAARIPQDDAFERFLQTAVAPRQDAGDEREN